MVIWHLLHYHHHRQEQAITNETQWNMIIKDQENTVFVELEDIELKPQERLHVLMITLAEGTLDVVSSM